MCISYLFTVTSISVTKDCPVPACGKKYKKPDSFYSHWSYKHQKALGHYKKYKDAMRKQKEAEEGNRPHGK